VNSWHPTATAATLQHRADLIARIRAFFSERGVTEVTTPVITASGVTDPNIDSIELADSAGYLRTSPEYWHKRLLAAGFGDLYELGPAFRDGECGRLHQVEFTLLEWYRCDWSWRQLADEVVTLIRHCLTRSAKELSVRYMPWNDCFREALGVDGLGADEPELRKLATDAPPGCNRDMLLDFLFATRIQIAFPTDRITVVHDYPASQAALARLKPGQPEVAERFEVFAGTLELANGYHELQDAREQTVRFEHDNRIRAQLNRDEMPIDHALLGALESGLPDCSGVALGVDRLLMTALEASNITEVMSFRPGRKK